MNDFPVSDKLYDEAVARIGGGVSPSRTFFPGLDAPLFFAGGRGPEIVDADGNAYVDYMLGWGSAVLGYGDERLAEVVRDQFLKGHVFTQNSPLHVELANRLVDLLPAADRVMFFKTGACATSAAVRLARAFTGRDLVVRCGFNGWHDWAAADPDGGKLGGIPESFQRSITAFDGSVEQLDAILSERAEETACVIVVPEDTFLCPRPNPVDAYIRELQGIEERCRRAGVLFVLDEVKTGIRCVGGSFQAAAGITPDLSTFSKALGGGLPLSAVAGQADVMDAASSVYTDNTFQTETVSLAAALHVVERLQGEGGAEHLARVGQRFIDGLNELFESRGLGGEAAAWPCPLPSMPDIRLHSDRTIERPRRMSFTHEVMRRGVMLHPIHLLFVSTAHSDETVDRTLAVLADALDAVLPRWD